MKLFNVLLLIITTVGFVSCEKEITVDVDETEPKLVIEAKMSNRLGDATVILTKSRNLNDSTSPEKVTGAEVRITAMQSQEEYFLNETIEGVYSHETLQGEAGKTYYLEVLLPDGQTFTSMQTMPVLVTLNEIRYEEQDSPFQDEEDDPVFEFQPIFLDPAGEDNYYQFIVKRNGVKEKDIFIKEDQGFDGLENSQKFSIEANYADMITIDMHNINESAYEYLMGVKLNLSQSTATPTNPNSNITGDALGYFKVFSAGNSLEFSLE